MRRLVPLILFALWLGLGPARAQFDLLPGYDKPLLGPAAAKGAVIWNHGKEADGRDVEGDTPFFLDALRDAGWDVFRLNRSGAADSEEASTLALIAQAEGLKAQGYPRLVSVGQSFGGWISYFAAVRRPGLFHAIVATAPAAFGEAKTSPNWKLNADRLYALAEGISRTRVMSFFFQNDPYDPGGRGRHIAKILTARGVPHAMIDRRPGLEGHGVARTLAFARAYEDCIRDFVEMAKVPNGFACPLGPSRPAAGDFALPAGAVPARQLPGPARPFAGRWFGWYVQGRQMMLIVQSATANSVTATYAWSAQFREPEDAPGHRLRHGRIDGAGKLIFDDPGQARLEFTRRLDGGLDVLWTRISDGLSVRGQVRRID
ncbi:alpha/beta hydrolase family protein [Desertibaculum subflavum]|uniref:alpha/beta hydrolase family protein n=1 Tax=Desertibaculum subflavum TaxID=2268458 RepID=UPI000E67103C